MSVTISKIQRGSKLHVRSCVFGSLVVITPWAVDDVGDVGVDDDVDGADETAAISAGAGADGASTPVGTTGITAGPPVAVPAMKLSTKRLINDEL
jgi:hypothetical protein